MRRISVRALSAVTLACTVAFAAPALAGSTDYFLKIKGVEGDSGKAQSQDDKHKNQIEILSYSWGETRKVSKVDSIAIKQSTTTDDVGQERDYAKEPASAAAGRANDRLRNAGPVTGWPSAQSGEAEITLKGSTIKENAGRTRPSDITLKRGTSAAAKPKSGSLSYLNRTRQKELLTPASAGSLTVVVPPGHGLCTAGKSLGTLTLAGSGGRSYVLTGVTVAGCEAAAAGDRPTESLSLNYTKIEF